MVAVRSMSGSLYMVSIVIPSSQLCRNETFYYTVTVHTAKNDQISEHFEIFGKVRHVSELSKFT